MADVKQLTGWLGEEVHRADLGNGLPVRIMSRPGFQTRFAIPRVVEFYGATEGNTAMVNFDGKPGAVGKVPPSLQLTHSLPAPHILR